MPWLPTATYEREYVVELFVPKFTRGLDLDDCGGGLGPLSDHTEFTLRTTCLTASIGFSYDEGVSEAAVLIFRLALQHRLSSPQKYLRMTVFLRGEMRLAEKVDHRNCRRGL